MLIRRKLFAHYPQISQILRIVLKMTTFQEETVKCKFPSDTDQAISLQNDNLLFP